MSTLIIPQRDFDREELRNDYSCVEVWDGKKYQRKLLLGRKASLVMEFTRLKMIPAESIDEAVMLNEMSRELEDKIDGINVVLVSLGLVNR